MTQDLAILRHLQAHRDQWISAFDLQQVSGSLATHSRVDNLRKTYDVVLRNVTTRSQGGQAESLYMLMSRAAAAAWLKAGSPREPGERPSKYHRVLD